MTFFGKRQNKNYFVFTVLPFGSAATLMLNTRLLGSLASFWHNKRINICVYLDDGVGTEKTYSKTFINSHFVEHTLKQACCVVNKRSLSGSPKITCG